MKAIILSIVILFCVNSSFAQSKEDQAVFDQKIWKVVDLGDNAFSFFDKDGKHLGTKKVFKKEVVYKDVRQRIIKRVPVVQSVEPTQQNTTTSTNTSVSEPTRVKPRVEVDRNRATYYDAQNEVIRTLRRRGRRVFYHDKGGKLIGYKIHQRNGKVVYKDPRGRTTGRSYIGTEGNMIYRPRNRRTTTPSYLFEDPFFHAGGRIK